MRQKSLWLYGGLAVLICSTAALRAEELVVSETLHKAAEKLFAEEDWVSKVYEDGLKAKTLQPGKTKDDVAKELFGRIEPLLKITPAQEEKFKKGEFDDEANKKAIEAQIALVKQAGAILPVLNKNLIAKHEAGKLKGCDLELAVRLNDLPIRFIKKILEKQEKKEAAQ